MYGFNWRTVKPFETSSHQGCHKSTSRSQTKTSLWTLDFYYSVIPSVPFIWWITSLLGGKVRSIKPTFVSAWHIRLTVTQTFAFTLKGKIFYQSLPFVLLCYFLKEFRPKKTTKQKRSSFIEWSISPFKKSISRLLNFEK